MQEQIFSDQDTPEQTYGFTVVPGTGQDGSALQQKLCAIPGVRNAEVSVLQGRVWVQAQGLARSVLEQAIAQSGYQVTGCTDGSGPDGAQFF